MMWKKGNSKQTNKQERKNEALPKNGGYATLPSASLKQTNKQNKQNTTWWWMDDVFLLYFTMSPPLPPINKQKNNLQIKG